MVRLLLVEDDPTLIRMLTDFLVAEGFRVDSVTGQKTAASAMQTHSPDLALVDISLAEGNGFAVCAQAKELGVPVIFLTASGDEFSVVTGLDMGTGDYVGDPPLTVYIKRLREKIEPDPQNPSFIKTVRGSPKQRLLFRCRSYFRFLDRNQNPIDN